MLRVQRQSILLKDSLVVMIEAPGVDCRLVISEAVYYLVTLLPMFLAWRLLIDWSSLRVAVKQGRLFPIG